VWLRLSLQGAVWFWYTKLLAKIQYAYKSNSHHSFNAKVIIYFCNIRKWWAFHVESCYLDLVLNMYCPGLGIKASGPIQFWLSFFLSLMHCKKIVGKSLFSHRGLLSNPLALNSVKSVLLGIMSFSWPKLDIYSVFSIGMVPWPCTLSPWSRDCLCVLHVHPSTFSPPVTLTFWPRAGWSSYSLSRWSFHWVVNFLGHFVFFSTY